NVLSSIPNRSESSENFRILELGEFSDFLILGARNKVINLSLKDSQIQLSKIDLNNHNEFGLGAKNCTNKQCDNYVMMMIPIRNDDQFNKFVCGSYYGFFQCIKAFQNMHNGIIEYFSDKAEILAPKGLDYKINNVFYLSTTKETREYVLYTASSWSENSQFLSAYTSRNDYQQTSLFKKIGATRDFVRFLENDGKLFLFQNEKSFEIDEGERDRDILISTSLVTQFCKNDENILNKKANVFYTDLTAKIYCFNKAFKLNSANFKIFKFDSLEYVSDLINIETKKNSIKNLFYGVFNTPKNQITGTAICIFDLSDFTTVFRNENFKQSTYDSKISNQNKFSPQSCPNLTLTDQLNYDRLTSRLGYMKKAILPVQKRRASFMSTDEFRLSSLTVLEKNSTLFPSIKNADHFKFTNIILAGTDNGKLMRMVHFFDQGFFQNQRIEEEKFIVIEDIQLFNNKSINEIRILKSKSDLKIVVVADNEVKIIASDFCQLHTSCEECMNANRMRHPILNDGCKWIEKCVSMPSTDIQSQFGKCEQNIDSADASIYIIKIQNTSNSKIEKIDPNKTTTKMAYSDVKKFPFQAIIIVVSALMSLILFIFGFIVLKILGVKSLEKFYKGNKKRSLQDTSKMKNKQSDYFENIYSIVGTNNRVQNLYQNSRTIAHSNSSLNSSENHEQFNIFQQDKYPSDLVLNFCSISISDSFSNLQQTKIGTPRATENQIKSINKKHESSIYVERPNIIIETENDENYFENSLINQNRVNLNFK
ncbi:semaphorin-1A-like isoform X1, partial [Brachionus plicatilis]